METKNCCCSVTTSYLILCDPWNEAHHTSLELEMASVQSVQFSRSAMSDSLRPHELQHARPPCPSPIPGVYPNPCLSSRWCHPAILSSVVPFSSCPQSLPASGSFPMSQLFTWGGQSVGVSASASVLPVNTQDLSPLGWTGWISLLEMAYPKAHITVSPRIRLLFHLIPISNLK